MNPFLFHAHPLLHATISLLAGTETFSLPRIVALAATYLALNVPLALLLTRRVVKAMHVKLRFHAAYLLTLPATVLYLPIGLTLLSDVVHHTFLLDHRFLFLFALLVATVLIAALYGVALHYRNGEPVGSETGLILALTIFLACIPYGLVLLGLDRLFSFFPAA